MNGRKSGRKFNIYIVSALVAIFHCHNGTPEMPTTETKILHLYCVWLFDDGTKYEIRYYFSFVWSKPNQ